MSITDSNALDAIDSLQTAVELLNLIVLASHALDDMKANAIGRAAHIAIETIEAVQAGLQPEESK